MVIKRMSRRRSSLASFAIVIATGAFALQLGTALCVEPDERLANPVLEARARALSSELRCLVCQNQSIDDSNAPLARDLRILVRERLTTGSSDDEILRYLVDRYGEFVLLRPRLGMETILLWFSPFALLAGVGFAMWRSNARRATNVKAASEPQPLADDEKKRLERILAQVGKT